MDPLERHESNLFSTPILAKWGYSEVVGYNLDVSKSLDLLTLPPHMSSLQVNRFTISCLFQIRERRGYCFNFKKISSTTWGNFSREMGIELYVSEIVKLWGQTLWSSRGGPGIWWSEVWLLRAKHQGPWFWKVDGRHQCPQQESSSSLNELHGLGSGASP